MTNSLSQLLNFLVPICISLCISIFQIIPAGANSHKFPPPINHYKALIIIILCKNIKYNKCSFPSWSYARGSKLFIKIAALIKVPTDIQSYNHANKEDKGAQYPRGGRVVGETQAGCNWSDCSVYNPGGVVAERQNIQLNEPTTILPDSPETYISHRRRTQSGPGQWPPRDNPD